MQQSHRDGLLLTLMDAVPHGAVCLVEDDEIRTLVAGHPCGWRVTGHTAARDGVDVVVLSSPLAPADHDAMAAALARVRIGGAFIARFRTSDFSDVVRDAVTDRLAELHPDLVFRGMDIGEHDSEAVTPWVIGQARRPVCWLFLGASREGKSSAAAYLRQSAGLTVFHGDQILEEIVLGRFPVSSALREAALAGFRAETWSIAIRRIFDEGLFGEIAGHVALSADRGDVCFEMWVPEESRRAVIADFQARGYFVFAPGSDLLRFVDLAEESGEGTWRRMASEVRRLETELAAAVQEIDALRRSRSWRLTSPVRTISEFMRRKR